MSVDSSGLEANGWSDSPSISGDGRYVVFDSDAGNLVSGDSNSAFDGLLKDRLTGQLTRVSVGHPATFELLGDR